MLLKMSLKKIMVTSCALLILFMIYLIPVSDSKEIKLENDDIEYVYPNTLETIYLLDKDNYVARTNLTTCDCDILKKAENLIQGLIIEGNKSDIIPNGFRSIIPSGTKILDLSLENGNMKINFSKDILDISPDNEEKMIESIVFTLTSLDEVDNITILVEGEVLDKLPHSGKKIEPILDKEIGINKVYDLTTFKDIESYTTYYVNNYNDMYYYVPVTKYLNNSNQDKIKLIIEQLSTSPMYQSNLMSFLNTNAKLLNYKLDDDKISLNFNNMILNDVASNNILEEVVYTICLSLEDELNVKEVVFNVNNEKIMEISLKSLD